MKAKRKEAGQWSFVAPCDLHRSLSHLLSQIVCFVSARLFKSFSRIDTTSCGGSARLGVLHEDFGKYCMIC